MRCRKENGRHPGGGHAARQGNGKHARACTQIQPGWLIFAPGPGSRALQRSHRCLCHAFCVCPRNEHARAHFYRKIKKIPLAQQILQGLVPGAAGAKLRQPLLRGLWHGGIWRKQRVCFAAQAAKLARVKRSVLHARLLQQGCGLSPQGAQPYHTLSSGRSGSTGVTAAMAHSIMLSSGSCVVMRCSHRPGALTARHTALSYFPHSLIIS